MCVLTSVCSELSVCRMKCVLIWSFMNECLFICCACIMCVFMLVLSLCVSIVTLIVKPYIKSTTMCT